LVTPDAFVASAAVAGSSHVVTGGVIHAFTQLLTPVPKRAGRALWGGRGRESREREREREREGGRSRERDRERERERRGAERRPNRERESQRHKERPKQRWQ